MAPFTAPEGLPQGKEKVVAVRSMFDSIAPRYDRVNRIMTFRMDVGWRKQALAALGLPTSSTILDLACGTGDLCRELAAAGLRPVGVDLSFGMLAAARTSAPLLQGDVLEMPFPDHVVDGVTCGFVRRNFEALPPFFAELARTVRPGGRIALLDVAEPPNPVMRFGHAVYFGKVVPRIGALFGSNKDAYRYLPRSVAYLAAPEVFLRQLADAGFDEVHRRLLSGGIAQLITATRRPLP